MRKDLQCSSKRAQPHKNLPSSKSSHSHSKVCWNCQKQNISVLFAKKAQITFRAVAKVIGYRLYSYFSRESHELLVNACHVLQYRKSKGADISNSYDHPRFLNRAVHPYHCQADPISCESRFKKYNKNN
jgi:hypothetical protein